MHRLLQLDAGVRSHNCFRSINISHVGAVSCILLRKSLCVLYLIRNGNSMCKARQTPRASPIDL